MLSDRKYDAGFQAVAEIFSSTLYENRLRGPPSHLSTGYWGLFSRYYSCRSVELTIDLHKMAKIKKE
jgi:hypothetical protein